MVWALAIGAAGLAWLLFGRDDHKPLSSGSEREAAAREVQIPDRFQGTWASKTSWESGLAAAGGGLALGAAIGAAIGGAAGPIGAAIGGFAGLFAGLLLAAKDAPDYGAVVRDGIERYLVKAEVGHTAAHVDAILFREVLLASEHVWHNVRTGALGVEILGLPSRNPWRAPKTSLGIARPVDGGAPSDRRFAIFPGRAFWQLRKQLQGTNPARLDGPGQQRVRHRWWDKIKIGEVYPIVYSTGHGAWNDTEAEGPGYRKLWPSIGEGKIDTSGRDWYKVRPAYDNVDELAARFDRTAGVRF